MVPHVLDRMLFSITLMQTGWIRLAHAYCMLSLLLRIMLSMGLMQLMLSVKLVLQNRASTFY